MMETDTLDFTAKKSLLPTPNYKVEQIVEKRKHLYRVTKDDGSVVNLPGTTGILSVISKPALYNWYAKQATENAERALLAQLEGKKSKKITMTEEWVKKIIEESRKKPEQIKDQAADLGTQAHAYFEAYCHGMEGDISDLDPLVQPAIQRFRKWVDESGLAILAGDTKVASLIYGVGGALDAIFSVVDPGKTPPELGLSEGDLILGDYKTSNGIYDEHALQVAAYDQQFYESYGIRCAAAVIVRFGKEAKKDEAGNLMPLEFDQKWLKSPANSFAAFLAAKSLQDGLKQEHFIGA